MKRLFALGGIVMLLLCFTVPTQATQISLSIDFEDGAEGEIIGSAYMATHYMQNMLGMIAEMSQNSDWCSNNPVICENMLLRSPKWTLPGTGPYNVPGTNNNSMFCAALGSEPPEDNEFFTLPAWIPRDKAAGLILMFFAPLESFSVDYAITDDGKWTWQVWHYVWEIMPNEATTMDIEVYDVMMDMTQTEKPPRLYEGEVTPLPALGDWETLALTGTQIEGARVVLMMVPAAWCGMAFDNVEFTFACYPADVDGESDVDGVDVAQFAALYNNNPGGDDNRDLDDLACFANEFGLRNMAEYMASLGGGA